MPEGTIDRPLSPSVPRDCGHECRVCRVTLASLTDYAGHISSSSHKLKVEAAGDGDGDDGDEDYFDQALVDLVHKRKEHIRKEKDAAARLAQEEEEERKRKEAFQQRLKEAKDQYRRECGWQQPAHRLGGPPHHSNWCSQDNGGPGAPPWHQHSQGRSATWHAQEPPNLRRWASGEFQNGQEWRGNRTWGQGSFPQNPQSRLPWLSSGGSSNGLYGRNNVSPLGPKGPNLCRGPSMGSPWPNFFPQVFNHFQNGQCDQQPSGRQNREGQAVQSDHDCRNSKSNPKPDKADCRSPYSVTKGPEPVPCSEPDQNLPEQQPRVSRPQETHPEPSGINRQSRPQQATCSQQSGEDKGKYQSNSVTKPGDSSRNRPPVPPALLQNTKKPQMERKVNSVPDLSAAQPSKASSQAPARPGVKSSSFAPLKQLGSDQQLQKSLRKAQRLALGKRGSLDASGQTAEQKDQSHIEVNKENRQKPALSDTGEPEKAAAPTPDCSQNLQSLQVSTSTSEPPGAPAGADHKKRKKVERPSCSDEAVQTGRSSESDVSMAAPVPGLSGLDLPPVLKRDLTKHISSKSKAGSHEPNLNIARRVRNLSESRRSDSEKDSGLKPTVRQLISTSGSRRSVNWDQVYQEVRKKQDRGKGMPRFGIEMVPCEQEYQSQEEDHIPLLEGFQWESLMDLSSQNTSRKRSLSESSLLPALARSPSSPPKSDEASERPSPLRPAGRGQTGETQPACPSEAVAQKPLELGDSSSGTEQLDCPATGKRRRAALDLQTAESSCLEHNSKRRKVKCKKERLQIDQLLSVSLREDELSRSLQTVDTNLVQARARLEAAFMEVQRLVAVKQQMTEEMNALRNTRIGLLRGMTEPGTEAAELKLKEEKVDPVRWQCVSLPFPPVTVKEEPLSPLCLGSLPDPADGAHSTTTEAAGAPGTATDPPPSFQASPQQGALPDPADFSEGLGEPQIFQCPAAPPDPPDPRSTKKVRKLKKRKTLQKAAGLELPESTDTELDDEASRPRRHRVRRRTGSTSGPTSPPQDDQMEPPTHPPQDSSRPLSHSLACNQVSSTSDLDLERDLDLGKSCKSVTPLSVTPLSVTPLSVTPLSVTPPSVMPPRNSSDASSDRGEDTAPSSDRSEDVAPSCGSFEGHREAVNGLQVHDGLLYTCSGDRTVRVFDLVSRRCMAVLEGHGSKVSCLLVSAAPGLHRRLYSGSSDQTVRCHSLKTGTLEQVFSLPDRVLCLHSRWKTLFAGLANGSVVTFNLKTNRQTDVFECHGPRAVSCLASSQEGSRRLLLVGSFDCTISVRDARSGVLLRLLEGHSKTVLCMKVVNDLVFSGSSDHCVHTHNIHTGELLRVYEGHSHAVTVVTVLGSLMVTGCLDKRVRVFDLQSHQQLQVYGGHSDMVTSLAVHKNTIYAGCYDGSVTAVRLDLTQSVPCQADHLQHHLLLDHGGSDPVLRCRWRRCEESLSRRSSKQDILSLHMKNHAEEETEVE